MINRAGFFLGLTLLSQIAFPHHARSNYQGEVQEITGELVSFQWRNPHISFNVKATNKRGEEVLWKMEAGSIYMLQRAGITSDLFTVGERVSVVGKESARQTRNLLATNMLFPDGKEAVIMPNTDPYWTGEHVGGRDQWALDEIKVKDTASQNKGIFRVWSVTGRPGGRRHVLFTESAIAARTAWDSTDNFAIRCEQPGMPRSMTSPHPLQFVDQGGSLLVRIEENDVVRTIYMDQTETQEEQPATPQGYSVGHWEDSTLIVETTRINWPWFDGAGTPQSEQVKTVEHFTLSEDQSRLDYHLTIIDPETFTEPAIIELYWLALGETVEPYDCEID